MNWTLKGRHGVVRRKLNQEGFKDCWGKTPRLAGRTAGEDCKGRLEKSARELFGRLQIPG